MDDSKIVSLYWDRNERAITESEENTATIAIV